MRIARDARASLLTAGLAIATWGLIALLPAFAQEAGQPEKVDAKYDEELIEEIIVRGSRWRTEPRDDREWRSVNPTVNPPPRVRMSLGYDPAEERELRSSNPLHDLSRRTPEPATVIRFRF